MCPGAAPDGLRARLLCYGQDAVGDVVGGVADSAVGVLADAVGEGVAKALASLGTVWVKIGTPNVTTGDGVTASPTVAFVQSQLWWYMAAAAILGVIIGGARMAWEQRAEPGRELLKGLLLLVVVSGCGLAMIGMTVEVTDEFARGVVGASLEGGSFGKNVTAMLGFTTVATGGTLGPLLVIVLGLIAILVSITQIMLMVVRAGVLVLLAGACPSRRLFTSTAAGRAWFRRFRRGWSRSSSTSPRWRSSTPPLPADGHRRFRQGRLLSVLVGLALMMSR